MTYALDTPNTRRHHGHMSEEPQGEYERLAAMADALAETFAGHNCKSANGTVHATGSVPWVGDLVRPGPYCHIGITGKSRPTAEPVDCLRCLRSLNLSREPRRAPSLAGLDQLLGLAAIP